ncbi:hypothetical protein PSEUDO9AG_20049 [Pseudomonas sp. 9Ag]|nr:hypothetical protein PSEUDO9AG_20049 [Pseudomonas sp. 9Ag]
MKTPPERGLFASARAVRNSGLQGAAHVLERHGGDDHGEDGPTDGADIGASLIECASGFRWNGCVDGASQGGERGRSANADFLDEVLVQLHG